MRSKVLLFKSYLAHSLSNYCNNEVRLAINHFSLPAVLFALKTGADIVVKSVIEDAFIQKQVSVYFERTCKQTVWLSMLSLCLNIWQKTGCSMSILLDGMIIKKKKN